jgi:hypothetical protein
MWAIPGWGTDGKELKGIVSIILLNNGWKRIAEKTTIII